MQVVALKRFECGYFFMMKVSILNIKHVLVKGLGEYFTNLQCLIYLTFSLGEKLKNNTAVCTVYS